MIENEIAKLENPLQVRLELLLVAELGEHLLVGVEFRGVGHAVALLGTGARGCGDPGARTTRAPQSGL